MNHTGATKDSSEVPERNESGLAAKLALPNRRWLPIVESFVLAGLLATFFGRSFLPAWRTLHSDFPNYYLADALYHRRIPLDRMYEWTWFQRQNDHLGVYDGLVSFAPNPPTFKASRGDWLGPYVTSCTSSNPMPSRVGP
jgi:hypothetical protein